MTKREKIGLVLILSGLSVGIVGTLGGFNGDLILGSIALITGLILFL